MTSAITSFPPFAQSRQALLDEASERTGLGDFGSDDFREGYGRLLDEMDCAGLSPEGVHAARENILSFLTARLRAVEGFKQHPEAMARPITRPLVVIGIVRSGTTALHKLLSMDPQFQGPEHWLCAAPQPRPPRDAWSDNADFRKSKAALDAMIEIAPEMLEDHGMAVDSVEESLNILAQTFCSNMFPSQYDIPRYDAWYLQQDDTFAYRYFADVLRLIGANDSADRRWLVKNPTDTFALRQVLNVFPDAMIVHTHRDPLQSVPSLCNLLAGAHRMFRGADTEMDKVFAREQEMWAQAVERADEVKKDIPGQYVDIQFKDFVADQMGTIRSIYDHFGLVLTTETEARMLQWLKDNPRKSTKMQRFTPEDFGGSTAAFIDRYADYRRRYGYAD